MTTLPREDAIDFLAQRMLWKFEHIDPTGETWDSLSDGERDMYRHVVQDLFCSPREWLDSARSGGPGVPSDEF
jgi:hypothetical protein